MSTTTTRDGVAGHRIATSLREAILRGDYAPGVRLRQEDIAEEFGASRLPVREALRILESDGLITLVANTGAWVAHLSLDECQEVYQIRERIEPLMLRYSRPGLSEATIDRLGALADEMQHGTDVETFLHLDREFHLLSYSGAHTTMLGGTVQRLWNTTQHYRRAFTLIAGAEGNRAVHYEHQLLVAALRRDDIEEAERVLYGHIRRTRLELLKHPELFARG
ncbi:GntR family transcriptional regulator [Galbitalea soli]|uniref:GntR family transcriptional regulator n=1 Tax=Galbitalea soli TaxID=1268042 RepID=A0A7C9PNP5_9MICO|nr:GntR family transcriptional regulator [Galbitalea soli]NEM91833.1 GntR family transcriptional regulator [Galbitalea soli]NYJ29333.1 DNA-binding GntR family transcriptional regulator [Galbitalea soli]